MTDPYRADLLLAERYAKLARHYADQGYQRVAAVLRNKADHAYERAERVQQRSMDESKEAD